MNDVKFILFTFVLARVGGLMSTAPVYGSSEVPLRVRALLAAALALLVVPTQWQAAVEPPGGAIQYLMLLGSEAVIGACLGLGVLIFIHGMTLAGELVGQAGGLTLSEVFDPALDENVPLFSRLMFLVAVSVFLCLGGHRMVMAGLLDTFRTIPPGSGGVPGSLGEMLVTLVGQSFSLGIRVAAPAARCRN
jgi:flagellar biosynthetic protein FliR